MRLIFCVALFAVACEAVGGKNDFTYCASGAPDASMCPMSADEFLVTTIEVSRSWTTAEPATLSFAFGSFFARHEIASLWVNYGFTANKITGVTFDPHGGFGVTLLDGEPNDTAWNFTLSANYGNPSWDPLPPFAAATLPVVLAFTSGQHGAFKVTSNVTPINEFDLDGLGLHITKLLITAGDWTASPVDGGYRNNVPVTFSFFGAPGEVPEPNSLALLAVAMMLIATERRRRNLPPLTQKT